MGLAEEIARVRMKARGAEINARHRRARERAQSIRGAMSPVGSPDGVNPKFAAELDAARERAKRAIEALEQTPQTPIERIEQLRREGKLPPRQNDPGVGYEPTPEELLGDLGEFEGETEALPDAEGVLSGAPADWSGAPPPPAEPPAAEAPEAAPLAQKGTTVQSKRKRAK